MRRDGVAGNLPAPSCGPPGAGLALRAPGRGFRRGVSGPKCASAPDPRAARCGRCLPTLRWATSLGTTGTSSGNCILIPAGFCTRTAGDTDPEHRTRHRQAQSSRLRSPHPRPRSQRRAQKWRLRPEARLLLAPLTPSPCRPAARTNNWNARLRHPSDPSGVALRCGQPPARGWWQWTEVPWPGRPWAASSVWPPRVLTFPLRPFIGRSSVTNVLTITPLSLEVM